MNSWLREWTLDRHFKASIRFGFLFAVMLFLFWGYRGIFVGPVPEVTTLMLGGKPIWDLAFTYNRWIDVPAALIVIPILWMITIGGAKLALQEKPDDVDEEAVSQTISISLFTGLVCGLLLIALTHGVGLAITLVVGVIFGLVALLAMGLAITLFSGLVFGLAVSFFFGLANGVLFSLSAGLAIAAATLAVGILLTRDWQRVWQRVWAWLIAAKS